LKEQIIMFKTILVPLDGSPRAEQALAVAARLARASEGSLALVQVVTPPIDYWSYQSGVSMLHEQMVETSIAEAESYLALLAGSQDLAGIKIKTEVMYGTAAQSILHVAQYLANGGISSENYTAVMVKVLISA
jgi:nucleotide-binding universal stress UspA family protein